MPTRSAEDYLRYQLVLAKTDNMVDVVESYFTWRALSTLSKCLQPRTTVGYTRSFSPYNSVSNRVKIILLYSHIFTFRSTEF